MLDSNMYSSFCIIFCPYKVLSVVNRLFNLLVRVVVAYVAVLTPMESVEVGVRPYS